MSESNPGPSTEQPIDDAGTEQPVDDTGQSTAATDTLRPMTEDERQ